MGIEVRSLRSAELGNAAQVVIERDSGVAVVMDPVRDVGQYLKVATQESVELVWALETYVYNGFVSGARELVASAGARLGASGDAGLRYAYERLGDRDEIDVGSWRLRVLATPGHTPEHVAYVLVDPGGEPQAPFSRGALMVGAAARTDLFGPALSWRFVHDLERTLKEKILELPDYVVVYPNHGGGSFCAVRCWNGADDHDKRGADRKPARHGPLLTPVRDPCSDGWDLSLLLRPDSQPEPGRSAAARPRAPCPPSARPRRARHLARPRRASGRRASGTGLSHRAHRKERGGRSRRQRVGWVGWLVGYERPLVLVADADASGAAQVAEATRQLDRIGYDRVVGFLDGGVETWRAAGREVLSYETISAATLAVRLDDDDELPFVVDVREAAEWHAGHVSGSVNIPAHDIPSADVELSRGMALAVHCGHDYRATLGASLLERAGHSKLVVDDGWEGWAALDQDQL